MAPRPPQVILGRPRGAADEVADLIAGLPADLTTADHHDDRRQPGLQPRIPDPSRPGDHAACAGLTATTPVLVRLTLGEVQPGLAMLQRLIERPTDILVEVRLVLLDRQQVLALTGDDVGGDLLLTPHGVDRHHGPFRSSSASNSGIAVISFDLASVATCPKVRRFSTAQALTTCR